MSPAPFFTLSPGPQEDLWRASPVTLLVVDDQSANIQALYQVFAKDYQVLAATSGQRALDLCSRSSPDLVLLDVGMPEMDGYEVLQRLKANPQTASIPVIFVTGRDSPQDEERGLALGAADFIPKPIQPGVVRARVKAHLDLSRSQALLSTTLESTADGILVADRKGALVGCNSRFAQMWQLPATLLSGRDDGAILRFMQAQVVDEQIDLQVLLDQSVRTGEELISMIHLRDGRVLERHLQPLRQGERTNGHVFSFRDVTQRVQAEQALADLNATLEAKVQQRTDELSVAIQAASAANEAKSQFLSNMSHEMRTPMNSILGLSFLALKAAPDEKTRDYLTRINESGKHLLGLISNVLDFSKIEAGRLDIERIDFLLPDLVTDVQRQWTELAAQKGLRLTTQVPDSLAIPVQGDPLRIRQILLNFVGNALKFSQQGEVRIRLSLVSANATHLEVKFEVSDEGIGLSEEQLGRLFQPFQQADTSTTRQFGGTGLGLAISRTLATLMGGQVGGESRLGEGSRFWLQLPLARGKAAAVPAETPPHHSDPWADSLADVRILVVDDNELNQRVAGELLRSAACTVLFADNGQEALSLLDHTEVDAVLMDMHMPVLDGVAAAQRLRQSPRWRDLPVIAMTASASRDDEKKCRDAGMNDFLTKPVIPDVFFQVVRRWVGRPTPVTAATAAAEATVGEGSAGAGNGHVDPSALIGVSRANPKMIREIVEMYLRSVDGTLANLTAACSARDAAHLADLSHGAKSPARTVGAKGLALLLEDLEREAKSPSIDFERAQGLIQRIGERMAEVKTELKALIRA
jgi:two-component system, sensor histidine kinase and response regulator